MKILYAIQGTGNGHVSRAREVIPHLLNYGHLDLLISGTQTDLNLAYVIKYRKYGMSYTFGKNGKIDVLDTIQKLKPITFFRDIYQFPVHNYDLIINDFEPLTAWACRLQNKPCYGLSHQAAYLSPKTPRFEKRDAFAELVFRKYAPVTAKTGFHFQPYDDFIHTPVIRSQVRKNGLSNKGHICVYLPAYADEILIKHFSKIPDVEWHVFSKHSKRSYYEMNVSVQPIHNDAFVESLCSSDGLVTNGGFESPAEAMYLHKKILAIPMSNQYEQLCNARALKLMGVTVLDHIDTDFSQRLEHWLEYACPVNVSYYDHLPEIIEGIMTNFQPKIKVAI